jgi:hypothetical protein
MAYIKNPSDSGQGWRESANDDSASPWHGFNNKNEGETKFFKADVLPNDPKVLLEEGALASNGSRFLAGVYGETTKVPDSAYVLWSPDDITTGAWYDASDSTTIAESGGAVSQWDDKSGNGFDISQGVGASQPTTNADTIGGLNAIEFDNDYLFRSNVDMFRNIGEGLIVSVVKDAAVIASNQQYMVHVKTGGAGLTRAALKNRSTIRTAAGRRLDSDTFVQLDGDAITANPELSSAVFNWASDELSMRENGSLSVSTTPIFSSGAGNTSDTDASEITIGNVAADPTVNRGYTGLIAETILVENDISIDTIEKLEGYLAWKWGLESQLPVGHPYKNHPPFKE